MELCPPGTMHFRPRYDPFWPCGLFTLLQFYKHLPHPHQKSIKPRWEDKLWGYFQWIFWQFHQHIEIIDSFFNDITYQKWFRIFLPLVFKYTRSVSCLSNHRDNKFTRWLAHSPLLFTSRNSTDGHWLPNRLLTSKWATARKVTFLKYGFTRCGEPTPVCVDIRTRHWNRRGNVSVTMLRVPSKCLRQNRQNYQHDYHLDASWPIRVHFRWSCFSDFSCMVGGSSDSCCLCQFLRD